MQGGYLSLLYSVSKRPLEYWSKHKSRTGSIRRVFDEELNENVLEIQDVEDSNCQKTWIMCPPETHQVLDIKLPFLVMVLKNSHTQCHFSLQVIDKDNVRHLINFSNTEAKKNPNKNAPLRLHLLLEPGWNKLEVDLRHLCKLFETEFDALSRIKICASCRLRRIYFTDKHYDENEMSLPLYQGFLDLYMLKWGIKTVERATQTKKTAGKSTITSKDNTLHPVNGFNKLFLKNLQAKSDKIVEEFFSKHSLKSVKDYLEFKRKAKIKPYVIPDNSKVYRNIRGSDSSIMDVNDIKRTFLRDNYLHGRLHFDEKKAGADSKDEKKETLHSIYKIRKYRYPEIIEKKVSAVKTDRIMTSSLNKIKEATKNI